MCQLWVWPSGSSTHRRERSIVIGAWKQISRPSKLTWKILILHITTCMNHIFFPGLVRLNMIFQSYYAAMVSDTCQGLRVSPSLPSHEQAISLPLWWKVRSVCVRSWFFFLFSILTQQQCKRTRQAKELAHSIKWEYVWWKLSFWIQILNDIKLLPFSCVTHTDRMTG